jgi:hypothetical protein
MDFKNENCGVVVKKWLSIGYSGGRNKLPISVECEKYLVELLI